LSGEDINLNISLIPNYTTPSQKKVKENDERLIRLFDWFTVLRPAQEFFTYMETSPLPWRAAQFRPMLGAPAFEQGGIFIMPHLL
jgi:hypothetical protein